MRHISRRSDDADVIRARLRALLDEAGRGGWVPEDLEDEHAGPEPTPVQKPDEEAGAERPPGVGRHRRPGRSVRWDPGRRGVRSLWTAGLLAALVLVAWTWLERPRVEPAPPPPPATETPAESAGVPLVGEAAETSSTVVVSVVGLVGRPGLVTVPSGARVADAIEAAGGLLPGADPVAVNLAAVVSDGQQIAVGVPGAGGEPPAATGPAAGAGAAPGGPVNLNTAGAAELDALPGIGPVLAQRIVDHREEQGPFRSIAQLDDVPGIGPAIAAALAELVTV